MSIIKQKEKVLSKKDGKKYRDRKIISEIGVFTFSV